MKISSKEDSRKVLKIKLTHYELKALQGSLEALVKHNVTVSDLMPLNRGVLEDFITQVIGFSA